MPHQLNQKDFSQLSSEFFMKMFFLRKKFYTRTHFLCCCAKDSKTTLPTAPCIEECSVPIIYLGLVGVLMFCSDDLQDIPSAVLHING